MVLGASKESLVPIAKWSTNHDGHRDAAAMAEKAKVRSPDCCAMSTDGRRSAVEYQRDAMAPIEKSVSTSRPRDAQAAESIGLVSPYV